MGLSLAFVFSISIISIKVTLAAWTISTGLFSADDEMAVGVYNGTILLLGGTRYPRQITEYDVNTQQFTDIGAYALSADLGGGYAQFWTQQKHIVYIIDEAYPDTFAIYNMITNEYTINWMGIIFNKDVSYTGCLASSDQYLFVSGGGDLTIEAAYSDVQILSLATHEWVNNPQSMNQIRGAHACVVDNDYLWVFGGYDGSKTLSKNERADITDVSQIIWNDIDPLTMVLDVLRAVSWDNNIYIVGGSDDNTEHDIVHVMDANTGTITVLSDNLPLVNGWSASIVVDAVLYVFGGFLNAQDSLTKKWAYYPLPTLPPSALDIPTTTTTPTPTKHPTSRPTMPPLLTCGQQLSGEYNDATLSFDVHFPHDGQLTFDASQSSFVIQSLTVVLETTSIAADSDNDGILSISNQIAADYTFTIQAAGGVYGVFDVTVSCQSNNPTLSPSSHPTDIPTKAPTPSPTAIPTAAPTQHPTLRPTDAPIKVGSPTNAPTPSTPSPTRYPTIYPTPAPTDTNDPTHDPSTNPTKSPITPSPTNPGTITCGERLIGPYNNAPIVFEVYIPYRNDLEFDASNSDPLTITSLSAIFGITPIAYDNNNDGILTLKDTVPGTYTFTIIAENGLSQMYDVQILCADNISHPTIKPTKTPTASPTVSKLTGTIVPSNIILTTSYINNNVNNSEAIDGDIMLYIAVAASFIVLCIIIAICVFCFKKRRIHQNQKRIAGKIMNLNMPPHVVAMNSVDVAQECKAQLLFEWLNNKVALPQYFDIFVENGYDSFKSLKRIRFKQHLREIGITKAGHVSLLMYEISKLKNPEGDGDTDLTNTNCNTLQTNVNVNKNVEVKNRIAEGDGGQAEKEAEPMGMSISSAGSSIMMYQTFTKGTPAFTEGIEEEHDYRGPEYIGSKSSNKNRLQEIGENEDSANREYVLVTPNKIAQCSDCGMSKQGKIYHGDGQFYCHTCWNMYKESGEN